MRPRAAAPPRVTRSNGAAASAAPFAIAGVAIAALLVVRACVVTAPIDRLAPAPGAAGDPAGTSARTGTIDLPCGGPYILGFESRAPARLEIAGHVIAGPSTDPDPVKHDAGVTFQRIVLPAGPAPIRFAAPPEARLIWHPPGRRGAPEYVPASSLAPESPDRASFGSSSGAAPVDGAIALAIMLVVAVLALWLVRARIMRLDHRVVIGFAATFALAFAVRVWGLGDAGQTWDEDEYWSAGRNDVQNLLAVDAAPDAWVWNYEHPPVTKYLAGAGALWTDGFGPARAMSALAMALGIALLVPIGARLFSWRVGAMAGVFAALSPHLIAHGQIIGHEAPTVLWWSLTIWLCLRAHDAPPVPSRRFALRLAGIGVVFGLAIMTRFVNALLAPMIAVTLLAAAPAEARRRTLVWGASIIPAIAILTSFAIWPRLWSSPFAHLGDALAKTGQAHDPEPFFGVLTATPPRWCFAVYLAATTPALLFLAALAFGYRAVTRWASERRATIVVVAWLILPLGVALSPVRQDGVRYVLPSLCALAIMAAAAIDLLPDRRRVATIAAGVLALYLAVTDLRVRPYYLDYYSELFGGPAQVAADKRFVISWWGEGVADAVAYVNDHAALGARVHRDCAVPSHVTWFRGDLWDAMVRDPRQADWIVWTQPSWRGCAIPPGARLVHSTEVLGAPLAYVYRNDPPAR